MGLKQVFLDFIYRSKKDKQSINDYLFTINMHFETSWQNNSSLLGHLRLDYCGFGPFCSTGTELLLSISLLMVLICIVYQKKTNNEAI